MVIWPYNMETGQHEPFYMSAEDYALLAEAARERWTIEPRHRRVHPGLALRVIRHVLGKRP